jgi:hypothetical protein
MLTSAPSPESAATSGITRAELIRLGDRLRPGRVDSPPISTMAAPSLIICRA